jgi:uncharacterized membrane protein
MTFDELLSSGSASIEDMEHYFKTIGINHVSRKQLDKIIGKFGLVVFKMNCFSEVYKIVLERESSRRMHTWTFVIGVMTVLYTAMTLIMLMRQM